MGLQKASIREDGGAGGALAGGLGAALGAAVGGGGTVAFQFNPETLSFTKSADFREQGTQSSTDGPNQQFVGTKPISLTVKMILDDTVSQGFGPAGLGASVADRINTLLGWTNPAEGSDPPEPKPLVFEWGKLKIGLAGQFRCHCKSVKVDYSLFKDDGEPLRATANVTLEGITTRTEGTNPTSGGVHARRTRRVQQGDDLAVIAQQEYGRESAWRALAAVNSIDNPFRLQVGHELLLPDRSELGSLN